MRRLRPRFTVRRLMVAVAIVGLMMAWFNHVRNLVHWNHFFAYSYILFGEVVIIVVALLTIASIIRLFGRDAKHLRRNDVPETCPWPPVPGENARESEDLPSRTGP